MRESLLQFIWQFQLYNRKELRLTNGQELTVLDAGKWNSDGGPDFINAKIMIDDLLFIGNIEIHTHAADFRKHKHHLDDKYKSLILHVVYFDDDTTLNLPALELNGRIPYLLLNKYETLQKNTAKVLCKYSLEHIDPFLLYHTKESMLFERLEKRSTLIFAMLQKNHNDWEAITYQLMGKYFGAHLNKDAFEELTRRLDYKVLQKHGGNIFQLEALLFGTAGFLNKDFIDCYPRALKTEFEFLRSKYNLRPLAEYHWQFSKIRPISFPTIRLLFFITLIQHFPLFQKIVDAENYEQFFSPTKQADYWNTHFVFDKQSAFQPKEMGPEFINSIYINVFVPILYAYGKFNNDEKKIEKAVYLLNEIKAESNSKVHHFPKEVFSVETAFDSQALIELLDSYCLTKKCLQCKIGHKLLRNSVDECMEDAAVYV